MANKGSNMLNWTFGVDVGEHSVGLAAVEYPSEDEHPKILAALSCIHDGGADPDGQVNESRKARAGTARRTRRLRRRRHARLVELEQELRSFGCVAPDANDTNTHDVWNARGLLVGHRITDNTERQRLLALAIMHMGRYRGWRNPWSKLGQLASLADNGPSANFAKMRSTAAKRFGSNVEDARTIGELASTLLTLQSDLWLRPRRISAKRKKRKEVEVKAAPKEDKILFEQIRQQDIYNELRLIVEVQQLNEDFLDRISRALFKQEPPRVPSDRVGTDDFDGTPRAPMASLAFQEFRIRTTIANLRTHGAKEVLSPGVHEEIVRYLLNWREEKAPSWQDIEEHFETRLSETSGTRAPVDTTSITIERSQIKTLTQWWASADQDMRADLVLGLSDSTGQEDSEILDNLRELLSDKELVAFDGLKLPSGRAAYGLQSLSRMNEIMREHSCNLYAARQQAFGVDRYWHPSKNSFAVPTGQPTVDRNLVIVGRFLSAATAKWGLPSKVVVELAREASLGDVALRELKTEQDKRRIFNDRIRDNLTSQGVDNPSRREITKNTLIERQGSECLYCGTLIGWDNIDIDHIVPRATGGSSRVSNLAAVCRRCNAEKGEQPFGQWAKTTSRPEVSLDAAIKRVHTWRRHAGTLDKGKTARAINNEFANYKDALIARLKRTSSDNPLDDRSLEPTSYAAVAVRERIEQFLESQPGYDPDDDHQRVRVYNGKITSLARIHGEFSQRVMLRGEPKKTHLDHRHHALDAIVLTSMRQSTAKVLVERDDLHQASRLGGGHDTSQEHYGSSFADQQLFRRWLSNMEILSDLTKNLIETDQVPVTYPIRLRPQIGRMHDDTGRPLVKKRLGDTFSAKEIQRITDRHVYEMLFAELKGKKDLAPNPTRAVEDEQGVLVQGDDLVTLFDGGGGMIRVGTSGFNLGTIHHVRVYAWRKKGAIHFGMIGVYGGEFGRIGFRKPHVDLFRAELPPWSESWRLADQKVLEAIASGEAQYIGWLTHGDELDFGPITQMPGGDSSSFFEHYPETRWRLAGFDLQGKKLKLRPLYLAEKGLFEGSEDVVMRVLRGNGWRPLINVICSVTTLHVIRRTALGRPRWHSDVLPTSWNPHKEAIRLLDDRNNAHRAG